MKRVPFRVVLLLIGYTTLALTLFALRPLSSHSSSRLSAVCGPPPTSRVGPGGFDSPHPANPSVQLLVAPHRSGVLNALNLSSSTAPVTALSWCQLAVTGAWYAISVDVGQEREVLVEIFVAYWWYFPEAEGDRLKELRRMRSMLSQVEGKQLMHGDWAEHDEFDILE